MLSQFMLYCYFAWLQVMPVDVSGTRISSEVIALTTGFL